MNRHPPINILATALHMPYAEPNNTPFYINRKSNHPPVIIRNLPESVNKRLSDISSDEDVLNRSPRISKSP